MPYRQAETACVVRLVPIRPVALSATTQAQCQALRAEAGRLWTDLVQLHANGRARCHWLTASDLEQVSAKVYRQQRDILHQAARKVVNFCQEEGVTRIAVVDVRDIRTGVSLGKATNQKISQWPHGQFVRYVREKAARVGISVEWIDESYSTKTCSVSGHRMPPHHAGADSGVRAVVRDCTATSMAATTSVPRLPMATMRKCEPIPSSISDRSE